MTPALYLAPSPLLAPSTLSPHPPYSLFSRDLFALPIIMDTIQIYTIAAGGTLSLFALVNLLPLLIPLATRISLFVLKHFTYPYLLHRHRILGPWSRAGVMIQLAYLAVNLFCVLVELSGTGLRVSSFSAAGRRAGTLAEVNMIPLLAGPHFAFLADRLGLSLKTIRRVHRSAGWMTATLVLLHALAAASDGPLPLDNSRNLYAVVVRIFYYLHRCLELNFDREHRCFACSSSSYFLSSASSRTSSSSDRTKSSAWLPSTRYGGTFLLTSPPRASISTSPWRYSRPCPSYRLALSFSEMESFAANCHAPPSCMTRARSRCRYVSPSL